MGYLVEGLELFIRKVAYIKYDATSLVRWSNYVYIYIEILSILTEYTGCFTTLGHNCRR
jgi:hypothetical protein